MSIRKYLAVAITLGAIHFPSYGSAAESEPDLWQMQAQQIKKIAREMAKLAVVPEDAASESELTDFLYSNIAMAYFGAVYADADYPDFWPALSEVFKVGWPNPDDAYYYVPIDDDGVYKISGTRGSVKILDFQINAGMAGKSGVGQWGPALNNYSADTLNVSEDGWFEVVLSQRRPAEYEGDWWPLGKGAAWVMARQRAYDWAREVDGRFGIERLDRPARQARHSKQKLDAKLAQIQVWAETWTRLSLGYARKLYENAEENAFSLIDFGDDGGFTKSVQRYPQAVFKLAADQAMIVETALPKECRYWNFQLVDTYWQTIGGNNQFNSINGHQATIDKDGKLRIVVSAVDPGVPNWLDTLGYSTGFVYGRWNLCSSNPLPVAKVVPVAHIRNHLPVDTVRITPDARDKALRERRLAAQMRRRW